MTPTIQDYIELDSVSLTTLPDALFSVQGYLKFASICWIRALGEPTLDGVIVKKWSHSSQAALHAFCSRHNCQEFLLRIDKHQTRWSMRRGGYIIPASRAEAIVNELSADGMIAAMLEPASPFRDLYCLACVAIPEEEKLVVEVVGPGFDTSDMLRSDLLPHERFEISAPLERPTVALAAGLAPVRVYLTTPDEYRKSFERRLVKIGANLKDPAFPRSVPDDTEQLRKSAISYLRRSNETVLLHHASQYKPIPQMYLMRFVTGVLRILVGLDRRGIKLGAASFAATFTTRRRFVFWDFFPADTRKGHLLYSA